jgi:hypothetical protein
VLRTFSCVIVNAMMAAVSMTTQAADTTLTLACQGTVTTKVFLGKFVDNEPEPISMGLIVNFTKRTVQGTGRWGPWLFDDQLPITELTEHHRLRGFQQISWHESQWYHGPRDRRCGYGGNHNRGN